MILMKRIPLTALQTAVYSLLTDNQTTPVYDDVPSDAEFPYVTLGAFTCKQNGGKNFSSWDVSQQIHIWSLYKGKKEVNGIANDVSTLLSGVKIDLSAANFNVITQDVDFFESFEEDDFGYHGVVTFVARVQDLGGTNH